MTTKPEDAKGKPKAKRPARTGCEPWWASLAQAGVLALAFASGGAVARLSTPMGMLPAALIGLVGVIIADSIMTRLRRRLMKDSHICGAKTGAQAALRSLKTRGFELVKLGKDGVEKL
ncbi:hypothetical protein [Sinomonas soli]